MDNRIKEVIEECTRRSDESSAKFPEIVMKLMSVGVEQYHADLVRAEKTYYLPNGESLVTPADKAEGVAPPVFSAVSIAAAVKASQQGKIDYAEFCRRIVAAGCVSYVVSLAGKRAIYSGRSGDFHIEHFPQAA